LASSTRTNICKGENTVLNASGAASYSWIAPSGGGTLSGSNTSALTTTPGIATQLTYSVTGTNANGCKSMASINVRVQTCNSIGETQSAVKPVIYPNPSDGEFTLIGVADGQYTIVDATGRQVRRIEISYENSYRAVVSGLSPGIYFLHCGSPVNPSQKIVIEGNR
jgi:hypothetical protein